VRRRRRSKSAFGYAKTFFEELVEYVTKPGKLYSNLAKEAFKPIENAITKVQAAKE
jgi:hypothetical protein